MTTSPRWFRVVLTTTSILLLAAGCSSDQSAPRTGGSSHHHPIAPPLRGTDTFFHGQISAELTVGRGFDSDRPSGNEVETPGSQHKRHGGGGFRMDGQGGDHGNRNHGGKNPMDDGDEMSSPTERQQMAVMRHAAANHNPPLMIHLRFTNQGTARIELLITDFLSPLGNFVVEPDKIVLEPGQAREVEPMTSRLAGEISGATVTLALRMGGEAEKKSIKLELVTQAETGSLPPAAAIEAK